MIDIRTKRFPFGRFDYLTLYCFLFIKGDIEVGAKIRNHETTHCRQHFEILVASLLLGCILIPILNGSWWWLSLAPLMPFVLYGFCWSVEAILPPYDRAYGSVCFETEAKYTEHRGYYNRRWYQHLFAWAKYVKNKKYPYLTKTPRYNPKLP